MRTETICISERSFMFAVGGQLFDQAPNRQPRKAEIIMQKVRDSFRQTANNDNEYYTVNIEEKNFYNWIHDLLFDIEEFQELNLTQIEFENGASVADESRPQFSFTTRYDKYDSESWKNDFIDLDAFVRNVVNRYWMIHDSENDCYLCIHQRGSDSALDCGDEKICKTCSVNPNLKNHYESCRRPRGKYTFACKYDCPKNKYICCEECVEKESCGYVCDSKSEDCGQKINEKKNK